LNGSYTLPTRSPFIAIIQRLAQIDINKIVAPRKTNKISAMIMQT